MRGGPTRKWSVYFKGLDAEEASKFLRTAELQTARAERLELTGVGRSSESQFSSVRQFLGERYDLSRARVVESQFEHITAGEYAGGEELRVTVELPSKLAERPSLLMRLRILFRERVSEPLKRKVNDVISRILNPTGVSHVSSAPSGLDIMTAIRRDLKTMGVADDDVRIEASGDWGDLWISEVIPVGDPIGLPA